MANKTGKQNLVAKANKFAIKGYVVVLASYFFEAR